MLVGVRRPIVLPVVQRPAGYRDRGGRRSRSRSGCRGWRASAGGETVLAGIIVNAAGAWADRVAELKARVDNGTYSVDNRALAAAIVRDDLSI